MGRRRPRAEGRNAPQDQGIDRGGDCRRGTAHTQGEGGGEGHAGHPKGEEGQGVAISLPLQVAPPQEEDGAWRHRTRKCRGTIFNFYHIVFNHPCLFSNSYFERYLLIKSFTQVSFSSVPTPDAISHPIATLDQEALRGVRPATPKPASAPPTPNFSLALTPEGTTEDFFDQMGVPQPSYAKEQRRNEARRLNFDNVSWNWLIL